MKIKTLSIAAATGLLPFLITSCGSDVCRECNCDIDETTTITIVSSGSSESETESRSRTFTACDSDVNNPDEPSWEYWESNPTVVSERTTTHPIHGDRRIESTTNYNCNCDED